MGGDKFFTRNNCQRCHLNLDKGRIMSWFTAETICMDCSAEEDRIKRDLKRLGKNPSTYEGCGFVPCN